MKRYVITRAMADGSEVEVTVQCDYDLKQALNDLRVDFLPMYIGVKPARGGMKWYLGGIKYEDITMYREDEADAISGN